MKKIIISVSVLVIIIAIAVFLFLNKSTITPSLTAIDQPISNNSVTVQRVMATESSWLVIQTETNQVPGPVIGYLKINKGETKDIKVTIDSAQATTRLFAMIHEDTGEKGKFDFPGNDMPLLFNGDMVSQLFTIK